jgi:hypothetical protein
MTQSFYPLNTEEEHTLLAKEEETTTPQAIRASYMYMKFSIDQFMECQFQMREVAQKLLNTPLFSFHDLKLNTRDIIVILKHTLNTTSSPLPIPDPHVIGVPSNTLERHSIGSCVVHGIRNLVISYSMAKVVGFPTSNSTFTY